MVAAKGARRPSLVGSASMARKAKDVALVYGPADDGDGFKVLRRRADSPVVEAGQLRRLQHGRAIAGEVVHLEARPESPLLFDVETDEELSAPSSAARGGPAQVATDQYRRGWEAIWGPRPRSGAPN
jgi:hypothetical protein